MVMRGRRFFGAAILAATLGVLGAGSVAHATHEWNCRDIGMKVYGKKVKRTVCYPCPPNVLPESTPAVVMALWEQEICAPST